MKNNELQLYLQTQIVQSQQRLKGIVKDLQGHNLGKRNVFATLHHYAHTFLEKGQEPRIIIMPGLRGTGKTTLLAQLFLSLPEENITKLYLSVEEAIKRFEVSLWDIIENYETLLNKHIEEFNTPLFIFLDEIHYDPKWSIFLKTMYDKSKHIMIFCTGSSALLLREQINADAVRRTYFVDINPISFSEYLSFKQNKIPIENIETVIRDALLFSANAEDTFNKLNKNKAMIQQYWLDVDKFSITHYFKIGTFPFTLKAENEILAVNLIAQIANKVIYTDIPQFHNFSTETLNKIERLLYLISATLGVSVGKLSETLAMKPDTLSLALKSLESSGLLFKVPPYGAHFKQVKKPAKYLFATPALRYAYLSSKESASLFQNYQGSLLEDLVGMYLNKLLPSFGIFSLTYDASTGGADFVITVGDEVIIMEVGMGKKDYQQIAKTKRKVGSKYNIIISNQELEYSKEHNTVKIPLKYFLLS